MNCPVGGTCCKSMTSVLRSQNCSTTGMAMSAGTLTFSSRTGSGGATGSPFQGQYDFTVAQPEAATRAGQRPAPGMRHRQLRYMDFILQ